MYLGLLRLELSFIRGLVSVSFGGSLFTMRGIYQKWQMLDVLLYLWIIGSRQNIHSLLRLTTPGMLCFGYVGQERTNSGSTVLGLLLPAPLRKCLPTYLRVPSDILYLQWRKPSSRPCPARIPRPYPPCPPNPAHPRNKRHLHPNRPRCLDPLHART